MSEKLQIPSSATDLRVWQTKLYNHESVSVKWGLSSQIHFLGRL